MRDGGGRVAVDVMGGDHGPQVIVEGALSAARRDGTALTLVGREAVVRPLLAGADGLDVTVVDAPDEIGMDEHAAQAVRRKPRSSIAVALAEVKAGRAEAMVSAGNSGAVMAAALLHLGRIAGVDRPAIASYLPALRSRTLVVDLGAVTDPKPHHLVQFARMGDLYTRRVLGVSEPTIGLLSNGEEPTKGNLFVQEVHPLLAAAPGLRFVGNVEGKDVPLGTVDIVVTDGFTGNVALKVAEGMGALVTQLLKDELTRSLRRKVLAALLRPAFRAVRARLDPSEIGGAPLLGVEGMVIIAHGGSDAKAIMNAVAAARRGAELDLVGGIRAAMAPPVVTSADDLADTARGAPPVPPSARVGSMGPGDPG